MRLKHTKIVDSDAFELCHEQRVFNTAGGAVYSCNYT
jgi:hypothetical protein